MLLHVQRSIWIDGSNITKRNSNYTHEVSRATVTWYINGYQWQNANSCLAAVIRQACYHAGHDRNTLIFVSFVRNKVTCVQTFSVSFVSCRKFLHNAPVNVKPQAGGWVGGGGLTQKAIPRVGILTRGHK